MHHSVGGVVAVGAPLVLGGSVVIAERFSVHGFWDDISHWNCGSAFQHIGELCRYLVVAPPRPDAKSNRLRLAIGNGLSPEVWRSLLDRLGPVRILEFYASTEGNVWLYNVEGKIGSIGRALPYLALRDPIALARFDLETQMPARGRQRILRALAPDGEQSNWDASTKILARNSKATANQPRRQKFSATYLRAETRGCEPATSCVATRTAFTHSFDRIGDTFRWKGENVATLEVSSVIRECPGVKEAIVYGVGGFPAAGRPRWHGADDDRRGVRFRRLHRPPCSFASIRVAALLAHRPRARLRRQRPSSRSRPIYVAQGCDPARIEDPLYVLDNERRATYRSMRGATKRSERVFSPMSPLGYKETLRGFLDVMF